MFQVTERICNKDFTVELDDGKMVKIEKDQIVIMPVYGFHHNPKFFPNPDQFSPDRWNEENRKNQNFSAYMPFGIGEIFKIN
jgi:cytochrome P450